MATVVPTTLVNVTLPVPGVPSAATQLAVTVTLVPSFFKDGLLGTASTVGEGPVVTPEVQAQSITSATAAAARPRGFGRINESSTVAAAGSTGARH